MSAIDTARIRRVIEGASGRGVLLDLGVSSRCNRVDHF